MQINEIVTRKTTERVDGTKRWFFEKKRKHKIDKPLAELREKRKTQVSKIRKERGDIATDYRNIDS